jgi:hypothetical protein
VEEARGGHGRRLLVRGVLARAEEVVRWVVGVADALGQAWGQFNTTLQVA